MHRELCFILFHDRRNRISHTLHSYEECLGSTKLEEHIQTDRNMILIIGYIEIYDSLILAILILHIGKAKATVLHTIICLDGNLTIKLYLSWSAVLSISNREFYGITLLPVGRIETAGTQEDVHHVKNTIIVGGILPYMLTIMLLTVLFEMTPTARIAVEYLIYRIALTLVSSLTEIHRRQIGAAVAEQSVAKHKDIIYTLIASCNKRTAISRLTMTGGLDDRHTGITSFYPNKLPIVIQIVSKELTRLEGCITEGTLGRHRSADQK